MVAEQHFLRIECVQFYSEKTFFITLHLLCSFQKLKCQQRCGIAQGSNFLTPWHLYGAHIPLTHSAQRFWLMNKTEMYGITSGCKLPVMCWNRFGFFLNYKILGPRNMWSIATIMFGAIRPSWSTTTPEKRMDLDFYFSLILHYTR